MSKTLRQNDYTGFTNKGAPLTNDEIDTNWTEIYALAESNAEAIGSIHTQNTDQYLDQGGANQVSASDLASLIYEDVGTKAHIQGTDQALDTGGSNEVSASDIKTLLDTAPRGLQEFSASGDTDGSYHIIPHSNDGAITVTFRSLDIVEERSYFVFDLDENAGVNAITLNTEGSETINGSSEITIATNRGYAELIVIGGNLVTLRKVLS